MSSTAPDAKVSCSSLCLRTIEPRCPGRLTCAAFPGVVFPAFGVHPWYLEDGALEELGGYLDAEETVAVGEIEA